MSVFGQSPFTPLNVTPAHVGHWLSPAGILAAFLAILGALPTIVGVIAALAAATFYVIETLERPLVKNFILRRRERKKAKIVAQLRYKQAILDSKIKSIQQN